MRQVYTFYADAFWIALKSILEHKLRAFLTLLGVIIGVSAVVVVGASISGLNSYVTRSNLTTAQSLLELFGNHLRGC